jgi:hypothetical protein
LSTKLFSEAKNQELIRLIERAVKYIHLGSELRANDMLVEIIDVFSKLLNNPNNQFERFLPILQEILHAQNDKDYIRVADLLEYELFPYFFLKRMLNQIRLGFEVDAKSSFIAIAHNIPQMGLAKTLRSKEFVMQMDKVSDAVLRGDYLWIGDLIESVAIQPKIEHVVYE